MPRLLPVVEDDATRQAAATRGGCAGRAVGDGESEAAGAEQSRIPDHELGWDDFGRGRRVGMDPGGVLEPRGA